MNNRLARRQAVSGDFSHQPCPRNRHTLDNLFQRFAPLNAWRSLAPMVTSGGQGCSTVFPSLWSAPPSSSPAPTAAGLTGVGSALVWCTLRREVVASAPIRDTARAAEQIARRGGSVSVAPKIALTSSVQSARLTVALFFYCGNNGCHAKR